MHSSDGATLRLWRARHVLMDVASMGGYFSVLVDGVNVGEIWPRQTKVFEVVPGDHQLCLRYWFLRRSGELDFSVRAGEEVELKCWMNWIGYPVLRPATADDSVKMRRPVAERTPPTNLGAEQPQ